MDWANECEQERLFLREQMVVVDRKIARMQNALTSCQNCVEADGLKAMLRGAYLERDLLDNLLDCGKENQTVLLATRLISQIERCRREAASLSRGWRRGQPTPAGYWEAESQHAFLTRLLGVYHAWRADRPYYPEIKPDAARAGDGAPPRPRPSLDPMHAGQAYIHPWYIPSPGGYDTDELETFEEDDQMPLGRLREAVYTALRDAGVPENHIEIAVQPRGWVMATGYAHDEDQHSLIVKAIGAVPGVRESLLDVQIVREDRCPVCHPPESPDPDLENTPT